jgi:hypothetical protein
MIYQHTWIFNQISQSRAPFNYGITISAALLQSAILLTDILLVVVPCYTTVVATIHCFDSKACLVVRTQNAWLTCPRTAAPQEISLYGLAHECKVIHCNHPYNLPWQNGRKLNKSTICIAANKYFTDVSWRLSPDIYFKSSYRAANARLTFDLHLLPTSWQGPFWCRAQ